MFFRVRLTARCDLDPTAADIVALVVAGFTNRMIGMTLYLSERSVKNYMTSILKATGARNRTHLAYLALTRGWVVFA